MKFYQDKNVLTAARERLEFMFDHFDHVYFSLSGGKDSGVMVQLADQIACEKGIKFDLLILDIEANYDSTCVFLEQLKKLNGVKDSYHFCLPFFEDNTTSIFQPQWMLWDPSEQDKWVQSLPDDAIQEEDLDTELYAIYQASNKNPDRFLRMFSYWYKKKQGNGLVACGIGIRAQESLQRYCSIIKGDNKGFGKGWINKYTEGVYNAYPIYDWKVEDIWGATALFNWEMNSFYERLYRMGVPLSEMRICQPFGLQQRKGLAQYALVEPKTWERVINRVSGANFGQIYAKTSLLGYYSSNKPKHMTWQEYSIFLLETMGLYSKKLQDHYYRKIKILMDYYQNKFNFSPDLMPDEASKKDWEKDERLWHNWKGIAKALEKNDFGLLTRQYSFTKKDEEELYDLFLEFNSNLGIEHLPKKQRNAIEKRLG
ncbi:TPA: DUF3440 domain-containing protein [Enterococcus faecium]